MSAPILSAREVRLNLGGHEILHGISLDFEPHRIHAILGPNGCGKTTLIKALCGATKLSHGEVRLDGESISRLSASAMARKMAVVWQGGHITGDITVRRLVSYGRYAHLPWWQLRPPAHDQAIEQAMARTGVLPMAERRVETLSGGERQRVWLAAALAQEPQLLLLDEPTTYLDIAHQIEVLDLLADLRASSAKTIVMVLHDLEQAAAYADRLLVLSEGRLVAQGPPGDVLTERLVLDVFGLRSRIIHDPDTGAPLILPRGRHSSPSTSSQPSTSNPTPQENP